MSSFETFRNGVGQRVEKKSKRHIRYQQHLYTKTLCKMNDPRDFWCGVAHFGFSVKNMILINKTKVFVDDGKNTSDHY